MRVCVSQPYGDGDTVYVIHGSGFVPFSSVTVSLVGVGVSPDRPVTTPDRPVVDREGTFNYAIDQGHHFFPGPIPAGTYRAVVTAPGAGSVSASFEVNPAGPQPPPPPPGGEP